MIKTSNFLCALFLCFSYYSPSNSMEFESNANLMKTNTCYYHSYNTQWISLKDMPEYSKCVANKKIKKDKKPQPSSNSKNLSVWTDSERESTLRAVNLNRYRNNIKANIELAIARKRSGINYP